MSYATVEDMKDRFGEATLVGLTDRTDSGTVGAAVVDAALADASRLIDGYVGGRYSLPLPAVPDILIQITCNLARHALEKDGVGETVQGRYDDALRQLRDIGSGLLVLDVPGRQTLVPDGGPAVSVGMGRGFGDDVLGEYGRTFGPMGGGFLTGRRFS